MVMAQLPLVWYPKDGAETVITQIICTDDATIDRLDLKSKAADAKQVLSGPVVVDGKTLTAYVIDHPAGTSVGALEGALFHPT